MAAHPLRAPCTRCGTADGYIVTAGGQDVARCAACNRYQYCAPRSETGREPRRVSTRRDLKPSRRLRILERDQHTCVSCHRADKPLHVGHLISVEDGRQHGVPEELIWSDLNLAAFCDECNLGLGASTVAVQLMWRCMQVRLAQQLAEAST